MVASIELGLEVGGELGGSGEAFARARGREMKSAPLSPSLDVV